MRFFYAYNRFVEKWMVLLAPTYMIVGILLADYLAQFKFMVPWLFAFMTFSGSLCTGFRDLKQVVKRPVPLFVCMLILHGIVPVCAFAAGGLLFPENHALLSGFVLAFSIPTGVVSLMWVGIYKGSTPFTLSMILIDTLLAPFVVPMLLQGLVGADVQMDVMGMMQELLLMVGVPALIAVSLNQLTKGKVKTVLSPRLAPFSKICMMCVITVNATGMQPFFQEFDPLLIGILAVVLVLAASGYSLGWLAARLLHRSGEETVSMILNSGMRNISAGAVIAGSYLPPEALIPVMGGTLFQQILAAVFGKLITISRARRGEIPPDKTEKAG